MEEAKKIEGLTKISGIGPETARKLVEKGIESPAQLARMRPDELAAILGKSYKASMTILEEANSQELTNIIEVQTIRQIQEYRDKVIQRIPTGSTDLDKIIDNGVPTDSLTGFTGDLAVGKTQVCAQLAVNCIGTLHRKVAWIETENSTFSPDRILEMAKASNIQIDVDKDIFVISSKYIVSPQEQYKAYLRVEQLIKEGNDIGLIIIDSMNAKIRRFYSRREQLGDRSAEINKHIDKLQMIASNHNVAIVMTIQVGGVPDANMELATLMKFGIKKKPSGGDSLFHSLTNWVSLQQKKTGLWEAVGFDVQNKPRLTAYFLLTADGVRNYEGVK